MRRAIVIVALATLPLSCGPRIKSRPGTAVDAGPSSRDVVCVMVGADGSHEDTLYAGSGRVVAEYTLGVLRQTRPNAALVEPKDPAYVYPETNAAACTYLVIPIITRWEDKPQWRGRDHITIVLHLMELQPWTQVRSVTFDHHSGNAVTKDQPASDILSDGFDAAVRQLVPATPPASAVKAVKVSN